MERPVAGNDGYRRRPDPERPLPVAASRALMRSGIAASGDG